MHHAIRMKTGSAIAAAFVTTCSVFGAGFQLYTEGSAEALAMGAAISGRTNLVSLAWYNPSALAGTEHASVMFGDSVIRIRSDFTSSAGNASLNDAWRSVPFFYYIHPISPSWTAMLSVNAPYGLITEWPDNWVGNGIATHSRFRGIYTTPSVAYKINERIRIAAGFNVVAADAELNSIVGGGVERKLEGDDVGYGYTASIHYQLLEHWAVGARYQSRVYLDLEGRLSVGPSSTDGSVDLTLPASINIGLANTSIRNLTLGLDVVWTEWSTYDEIAIETDAGTSTIPKDWDDVWSMRVGAEYALNEMWVVRGGYVWDESPVPDTTRAPELPGSDRQMVMGGIGWKWKRIGIDAAYAYLWAEKANMGSIYPLTGEFDSDTQMFSIATSCFF